MPIMFLLFKDGGFTAGDSDTGLTAYAYPSSTSANRARRRPAETAIAMLRNECAALRDPATEAGRAAIAYDDRHMALLHERGIVLPIFGQKPPALDSAPSSLADPAPCEATEQGLQYVIPGAERRLPPTRAGKPRKQDARQDNLF